ncbi:tape measure protein [Streptococcus dysgalactiae]|uniref:Phage protein n=1 Tax=Streptococcus dysgalactiae subsp. equisimilis TaxID=119602 RepID=A0AAE9U3X7_STREQ|nr:tape measure protein [Streptococcus dysgalactiae]VTT17754.1 phage protein [Streptococcus dysgalactiae]VTT27439.1 phage protein [Streptococcus dysgalactiae subsp. equisimilis]HEP2841433.1 tape measure protein [Streptococcus pyogenes]
MADGKVTITVDLDGKNAQVGVKQLKGMLGSLGDGAGKTGGLFRNMLGANVVGSALMSGLGALTSTVGGMYGELSSNTKAWKTFEGNLTQVWGTSDKTKAKITEVRKTLQNYAAQTIYSASDMAQTYSQLAAVGIQNTDKLVMGFGGLAAAAENPTQAMKTLSQQATQMAAKPKVQWMDFKLMLEQTPAGIAAVAKQMGMSTAEMVKAVQDGKISTQDFFDAISAVGTNDTFSKMATEFKTIDQAVDGLKENVANNLAPVFDVLNKAGIKAVESLTNSLNKINFEKVASMAQRAIDKVGEFFNKFKDTGALSAAGKAFGDIGRAIGNVLKALSGGKGDWTDFGTTLGNIVTKISEAASAIANFVGKMEPGQLQSWIATFASVIGGFKLFSAITGSSPIGAILGKLGEKFSIFGQKGESGSKRAGNSFKLLDKIFGTINKAIGGLLTQVSKFLTSIANGLAKAASKANPAQWLSMGAAMLMVGAGVALVAGGIYILVQAAIQLGSAGTSAQLALVGLGVGIAALAGIFALLGPTLTAGAVGIVAFGAAVALIGAGVYAASAGLSMLAGHLPTIATYGASAAVGIAALGAGLLAMGAGAMVAGAGLVVVGAGLAVVGAGAVVAAAGAIALGAGLLVAAAGVAAFGVALNVGKPGLTAFANAITKVINALSGGFVSILNSVSGVIKSVGQAALNAGKGFNQLASGVVKITNTNLGDMAASLAAVAVGVGKIAGQSAGLAQAGSGMIKLGTGMSLVSSAATTAVVGLTAFTTRITTLSTTISTLPAMMTTAASGFASFTAQAVSGVAGLSAINAPIAMFKSQIMTIIPALMMASAGFTLFGSKAMVISASFATIGGLITAFNAHVMSISTTMTMASASFTVLSSGVMVVGTALTMVSSGFAQVSSSAAGTSSQLINMATSTQLVITAFNAMRGQVQSSMQAILSIITSVGSQMKSQGSQIGQQTARNIAQGISGGIGQSTGAMQALMNAVRSVGMSGVGSMRGIGAMIGQGLAQGMYSALGAVTAAANALVAQAERAARAKAQIHSPSRLFRDSVGRFLPMGVAVGIEKGSKYVDKAIGGMYDNIQAFSYKAEDIIGVGKTKLSKVVQVKSDFENAIKAKVEVAKEKSNNLMEKALDIAEKAVERPSEIVLDDDTLVAKTGDKYDRYQAEQTRRKNRMRGITI